VVDSYCYCIAKIKTGDVEMEKKQCDEKQYIGFMYLKCSSCGHIRGFYAKAPLHTFRCDRCKNETELIGALKPLVFVCECGRKWLYKTNFKEDCFDIACFDCGYYNTISYNHKKERYSNA